MKDINNDYITLYPSYWIYNAGIVGIIQTLKAQNNSVYKEGEDYIIGNDSLKIRDTTWEKLTGLYIKEMEKRFGRTWFVASRTFGKDSNLFPNNFNPSTINSARKKISNKIPDLVYEKNLYKNIGISKWDSLFDTIEDLQNEEIMNDINMTKKFIVEKQLKHFPQKISVLLNDLQNKLKAKKKKQNKKENLDEKELITEEISNYIENLQEIEWRDQFVLENNVVKNSIDWRELPNLDIKKSWNDLKKIYNSLQKLNNDDYLELSSSIFEDINDEINLLKILEKKYDQIKGHLNDIDRSVKDKDIDGIEFLSADEKKILKKKKEEIKDLIILSPLEIKNGINNREIELKKMNLAHIIWDVNDKNEIVNLTGIIRDEIVEKGFRAKLEGNEKKRGEDNFQCSFCGSLTNQAVTFETKWFAYEGGGEGFKNFLWHGSSQLPICNNSKLVLFFSPFGIFPDENTNKGEFINIPNIKTLWELNNYRMSIYHMKKEKKKGMGNNRSQLIDAIVSTGAYLQLKSRWLLQNIEVIELGGKRPKTVHNFEISPSALKLLTDHSSTSISTWLSTIETFQVKSPPSDKSLYEKNTIYSKKEKKFVNGKTIIEKFLANERGGLTNIAIRIFKLYFEKDKLSIPNLILNDYFSTLKEYGLKPLLFLILSLIHGKESRSIFLKIGEEIGIFFLNENKNNTENKNEGKDIFEKVYFPSLFNHVYNLKKNDFVEMLIKIYMGYYKEVDTRLINLIRFSDIEFQAEALMLLIGVLEKLNEKKSNYGEYDER